MSAHAQLGSTTGNWTRHATNFWMSPPSTRLSPLISPLHVAQAGNGSQLSGIPFVFASPPAAISHSSGTPLLLQSPTPTGPVRVTPNVPQSPPLLLSNPATRIRYVVPAVTGIFVICEGPPPLQKSSLQAPAT